MLQRWVLIANAIISGLFGLGFLFAANAVLGLYGGMSMEPATDQLFGGALIGLALINVLARDVQDRDARLAVFAGNFVYNVVTLVVFVMGVGALGSAPVVAGVVVAAVFTVAFGSLLFTTFQTRTAG